MILLGAHPWMGIALDIDEPRNPVTPLYNLILIRKGKVLGPELYIESLYIRSKWVANSF